MNGSLRAAAPALVHLEFSRSASWDSYGTAACNSSLFGGRFHRLLSNIIGSELRAMRSVYFDVIFRCKLSGTRWVSSCPTVNVQFNGIVFGR